MSKTKKSEPQQENILKLQKEIEERKQAEEEFRKSQNMLQLVINNTPQIVFWKDRDSVFLGCNQAFADHIGIKSLEEIVGKTDYDLPVSKKDADSYRKRDSLVMESGKPEYHFIEKTKKADGTEVWLDVNRFPIRDEKEEVIGVLVTVENITERKESEDKIKDSEEKLRNITDYSTNVFYSHTPEHVLTYLSPQIEKLIGYSPDEAKVKWTELTSDNPINESAYKITCKAIETGKAQPPYMVELIHKSGEKVLVEIREAPVVVRGKTVSIVGSLTDVTDRIHAEDALRISEEKLRLIINNIPQAVYWKDRDSVFRGCNQGLVDLLDVGGPEDIIGKTDYDFAVTKKGADSYREVDRRVMESGTPEFHIMKLLCKSDGTLIWLDTNKIPLRDKNGIVTGVLVTVEDITERKRMEEKQLAHLNFMDKLERIDEVMRKSIDIDKLLSGALEVVLDIFECDRAWLLYPCDPDADTWSVPMERTKPEYPGAFAIGENIPMKSEIADILRAALDKDDVITIDYRDPTNVTEISKRFSMKSEMHLAVHTQTGKSWIFGLHQCSRYRDWTEDEQDLFKEIGRRLGDGLSVMLSFKDLQVSEENERNFRGKLIEFYKVSTDLSKCTNEDELWKTAVELGRSKLDFDRLSIWIKTEKPGEMNGTFGTDSNGKLVDERHYKSITIPGSALVDKYSKETIKFWKNLLKKSIVLLAEFQRIILFKKIQ